MDLIGDPINMLLNKVPSDLKVVGVYMCVRKVFIKENRTRSSPKTYEVAQFIRT